MREARAGSASRRVLLQKALLLSVVSLPAPGWAKPPPPAQPTSAWADWDGFAQRFLQADGRVLANAQGQTHSEAQSYALMFALIANDRLRFARILRWTEDNLCAGDITTRLPAWLWGQKEGAGWGVLDSNAASDADVWIAYALAEAGRLWQVRRYRALAAALAERIRAEETADLPGLGRTLLPGPVGFVLEAGQRWRLNPSYLPVQALRRLAALAPAASAAHWQSLLDSSLQVIVQSSGRGFAPDWVLYQAGQGLLPDHQGEQQALGAYNAIRVYLWAGMLAPEDPAHAPLLQALAPMVERVTALGYPPETIDSVTGVVQGAAGGGFAAALLPLLQAAQATQAVTVQQQYLAEHPPQPDAYYGQCLTLWGQGWMQGRYRFAPDGQLLVPWKEAA